MRHSVAGGAARPRLVAPELRLLSRPKLRVADVALLPSEGNGGASAYLEAKAASGVFDHHVITLRDLRALRPAAALKDRLQRLAPDVVLVHDALAGALGVTRAARATGARVVGVPHGAGRLRRAYDGDVDAVISALPTVDELGHRAVLPLGCVIDPAFHPRPEVDRGDHVLYVGRLGRAEGVLELLDAAAHARDRWPLRIIGSGPLERTLRRRAQRLRVAGRVSFEPCTHDRESLARAYASARVVVVPTGRKAARLLALEGAACGARVVCCTSATILPFARGLTQTFVPGSSAALSAAIFQARRAEPDQAAAWRLTERYGRRAAFAAEEEVLRTLLAGVPARE